MTTACWISRWARLSRLCGAGIRDTAGRFLLTLKNVYTGIFAEYAKKKSEKFYFYNSDITDKNFAAATQQLVPGKTYGVTIFAIKRRATSEVTSRAIIPVITPAEL